MSSRAVFAFAFAMCGVVGTSRGGAQSLTSASTAALVPASMVDPASAWGARFDPPTACMAAASPSSTEREAIYLDARMAPGTSDVLLDQADLLASDVATTMNALLTSPNSPLANLAGRMKYYSVPAELIIVARRKGEMSWRGVSESGDSTAYMLLSIGLDSARHRGGAIMLWPDGVTDDSLVIRLSLLPKEYRGAPVAKVGEKLPRRFPAFALPSPKITPPRLESDPPHYIWYPAHPGSERINGNVQVEFVIDTTGRVAMSSFHDVWPADKPRLTGTLGAYYDQLLGSVKAYE